ncbi:unnamed protein product [Absidia cylindrospora]
MVDSPWSAPINEVTTDINISNDLQQQPIDLIPASPDLASPEPEHVIGFPEETIVNRAAQPDRIEALPQEVSVIDQLYDDPILHDSETPTVKDQQNNVYQSSSQIIDQSSVDSVLHEHDHEPETSTASDEHDGVYRGSSNQPAKHHDDDDEEKKERKKKKKKKSKKIEEQRRLDRKKYQDQPLPRPSPGLVPPSSFNASPSPSLSQPQQTIPSASSASIISPSEISEPNEGYYYEYYDDYPQQPTPSPAIFTVITRAADTTTVYIHHSNNQDADIRIGMGMAPPIGSPFSNNDDAMTSSATMLHLSSSLFLCYLITFLFFRNIR